MAKQLPKELIMELKEAFSLFDKDGDETISTKNLGAVMKSLGQNPTEAEIQDIINNIDTDHCESIEFPYFVSVMVPRMKDADDEEGLIKAFKVFDRDSNGRITITEFKDVLTNCDIKLFKTLTEGEVDAFIREGFEGNGTVNYEEIVRMMRTK